MKKIKNFTGFLILLIIFFQPFFCSKTSAQSTSLNWQSGQSLLHAVGDGAAFILNNNLYFIGGWAGDSGVQFSEIYKTPLSETGIPNNWTQIGNLSKGRMGMGYVSYNNRLYLIGGHETPGGIIQKINSFDGNALRQERDLPEPINLPAVTIIGNYLYVIGGLTTGDNNVLSKVRYANINSDGSLGEWQSSVDIPRALATETVLINRCLYIIGGRGVNGDTRQEVYRGILNTNNLISSWLQSRSLPEGLALTSVISHNNDIYVFGGDKVEYGTASNKIYKTTVNSDCSLSEWSYALLPEARMRITSISSAKAIYLMGGASVYQQFHNNFWYSLTVEPTRIPCNQNCYGHTDQCETGLVCINFSYPTPNPSNTFCRKNECIDKTNCNCQLSPTPTTAPTNTSIPNCTCTANNPYNKCSSNCKDKTNTSITDYSCITNNNCSNNYSRTKGDVTGDGKACLDDYNLYFQALYGLITGEQRLRADFNGNNFIDDLDLQIFRNNYNPNVCAQAL